MYEIKEIDDLTLAFPANVMDLMPEYSSIPDEYKSFHNKYNKFVTHWFFRGLDNPKFNARTGVDEEKALRHICAIMHSFQPKHEHKTAACAFLLSEWFESIEDKNISV